MVFAEPGEPTDGPFDGWASWFRVSGSPEACAAREAINTWYASFGDRDSMVLSRLRADGDSEILQAVDELYVHQLLSRSCQARYEEDTTSPDFRLYRSSEYLAGVEVLTLFPEQEFLSEVTRNSQLVDAINRGIRPTLWYVYIAVLRWTNKPHTTDAVTWLKSEIGRLPAPAEDLTYDTYPRAVYSSPEVKLEFTFLPRRRTTPATATEPIVMAGPIVARFVRPAQRLRNALSRKSGSKYEHRDQPFAVVVSVRDFNCDVEDLVNTLYGDDAITFDINNPDSARPNRKRNGTFAMSRGNPQGRNRRLSCVFALMRGWTPGSDKPPTVFRFDNPFAKRPFPEDLLPADHRMISRRDDKGVRIEWDQVRPLT